MKKLMLILLAIVSLSATAQNKQKIKGNREVLIKKFTIAPFNTIEIGEKFKVNLQNANDTTRVVIETDDNLFDVIHFNVENKVLKFWTSMKIVKKKRLRITVFVPKDFNTIKLIEKGQVFNENELELKNLNIEALNKSEAKLNLRVSENLNLKSSDKSNLNLVIHSPKTTVIVNGNAFLKANFDTKIANIETNKSANSELTGSVQFLKLKANDKSKVTAKNLKTDKMELTANGKTNVYINVSKEIIMKLSGKSKTYLFGSPEINLKTFEDNAILYKK